MGADDAKSYFFSGIGPESYKAGQVHADSQSRTPSVLLTSVPFWGN